MRSPARVAGSAIARRSSVGRHRAEQDLVPATASARPACCGAARRRSRPAADQPPGAATPAAESRNAVRSSSSTPRVNSSSNWSTTTGPSTAVERDSSGCEPGVMTSRRCRAAGATPAAQHRRLAAARCADHREERVQARGARRCRRPPPRARRSGRRRSRSNASRPGYGHSVGGGRGVHARRGDGEDLLGLADAPEPVRPEVDQARRRRAGGAATRPAVTRDSMTSPPSARPRRRAASVERGADVVAAAPVGLAGVDADADRQRQIAGPGRGRQAVHDVDRGADRRAAAPGTSTTVESPSPCASRKRPPCRSTAAATRSSCTASARAMSPGRVSHFDVEPTMSVRQNVSTPVGSVALPTGPQPLDQLAGRLGPLGRVGAQARRGSPPRAARPARGRCPPTSGRMPVGGSPVSSAKAVAASE